MRGVRTVPSAAAAPAAGSWPRVSSSPTEETGSGGSIQAHLTQRPGGESTLKTSGGGITLTVASNVAIDLDAHTSGGDIETDVPVTLLGKQSDSTLNGKLNGGGPRVVLRTSGGDIRLRKM